MRKDKQTFFRNNILLLISLSMLIINVFFIFGLASFDRIVYMIFFYHVSSAWLSYFSFGISLICHIQYLRSRKINWNRLGKNSIIVGVCFTAFTLITGSIWYNAASTDYNNVFWQWSDARQTTTLVLFLSYLSYLIFRSSIEDKEKKAKLSSALGIVLFPTVPLSYFSALIFTSLHPLINPITGESGHIYWDLIKLLILFFNLISMTILFVYVVQELTALDEAKDELEKIIQKKLIEE